MDIVKWLRELRLSASNADWNSAIVNNRLDEAADKIEQLRGICKELLQHAEYMLSETEKAMEKDVTLLQKRISRARAALKEGE